VDQEAERNAFARAWGYLDYNRAAKWTAMVSAVGTGILYVALLGVLWLFADLVVYQGRIPSYDDLDHPQQESVARKWDEGGAQEAEEELQYLGLASPGSARLGQAPFRDLPLGEQRFVYRLQLYRYLRDAVGGQAAGLVLPAFADLPHPEQQAVLKHWAELAEKDRRDLLAAVAEDLPADRHAAIVSGNVADLQPVEKDVAWLGVLLHQLNRPDRPHRFAEAGLDETVGPRLRADAGLIGEGAAEMTPRALDDRGVLSLVVRSHLSNRLGSGAVAWLARTNGWWMWKHGNSGFLTGLLVVAVVLALLRALLSVVMSDAAARATIEASTRLRRAVYHHTFRLGTLAFQALGPSEAVTIFTRHVEAVQDALYLRLTVFVREPVKFGLLLAFALFVNFWLALAFLLFALLVWLIGGQVAAYFRRQARVATNEAAEGLTLIRESLMFMSLVKVYLMELFNQARVERLLSKYADALSRRYRGEAIYPPLLIFLGTLAGLVLLYVAGLIVLHGRLGAASAITLAVALVSLYWPVQALLENRRVLRRGREAAAVLFKFLDRPGEVGQVVGAEFLPPLARRL
jgi:ABC-type multidrug transport system fused ATPase/permease subunit